MTLVSGSAIILSFYAQIQKDYPHAHYKINFETKGSHTYIHHVTTYPDLEQFESALNYGFKEGCINAYALLDALLNKIQS